MRRHIIPLFAANLIAFASVGVSYLVYSRLLTAEQFAAYAAALAVGNLFVLVLDGGVRTAIIKHPSELPASDQSMLLLMMLAFSVLLLFALYAGQSLLAHFYPALRTASIFISWFAAVFLLTYPWIALSTAGLERDLQYSSIAWIESVSTVIERGSPAILLLTTRLGLGTFVAGLLLGRLTRVILLRRMYNVGWRWHLGGDLKTIRQLLGEGFSFQMGGAASLFRDNAHVFIVGPLFGAAWVGYYAWGFQLCTIASQAFVQIAARVALPVTAKAAAFSGRWPTISLQVALLTAATAPILAVLLLVAPILNHYLFADKWLVALTILPLLSARMVPGIACTPVGTLLLVEKGATRYAYALWLWTAIELLGAYTAVRLFGARGMAMSYAITAWAGLFILIKFFGAPARSLFSQTCKTIMIRPGTWAFGSIAGLCLLYEGKFDRQIPWGVVVGGVLLSLATLLIDPLVRSSVRKR